MHCKQVKNIVFLRCI